jgi:hypothetical protein
MWYTGSIEVTVATVSTIVYQYDNTAITSYKTIMANNSLPTTSFDRPDSSYLGLPTTIIANGVGGYPAITSLVYGTKLTDPYGVVYTSPTPYWDMEYVTARTVTATLNGSTYACDSTSGVGVGLGISVEPSGFFLVDNDPGYAQDNTGEIFTQLPTELGDWIKDHPATTTDSKNAGYNQLATCTMAFGNGVPVAHVPVSALTASASSTTTLTGYYGIPPDTTTATTPSTAPETEVAPAPSTTPETEVAPITTPQPETTTSPEPETTTSPYVAPQPTTSPSNPELQATTSPTNQEPTTIPNYGEPTISPLQPQPESSTPAGPTSEGPVPGTTQVPGNSPAPGTSPAPGSSPAPGTSPVPGSSPAQGISPGSASSPSQGPGKPPSGGSGPGITIVASNGQTSVNTPGPVYTPQPTTAPAFTAGGSTYIANPSSNYVIGSSTLTPGGTVIVPGSGTESATTYVLPVTGSAVIINGNTQTIQGVTTTPSPALTPAPYIVIGSSAYVVNSNSAYVVGSQTLTQGGVITVPAGTVSLESGGSSVVIISGGSTTTSPLGGAIQSIGGFGPSGNSSYTGPQASDAGSKRSVDVWVMGGMLSVGLLAVWGL